MMKAGILLISIFISGCSTVSGLAMDNPCEKNAPRLIYRGVQDDVKIIYDGITQPYGGYIVVGLLDFPFSFAMDTILLPWAIPCEFVAARKCVVPPDEEIKSDPVCGLKGVRRSELFHSG